MMSDEHPPGDIGAAQLVLSLRAHHCRLARGQTTCTQRETTEHTSARNACHICVSHLRFGGTSWWGALSEFSGCSSLTVTVGEYFSQKLSPTAPTFFTRLTLSLCSLRRVSHGGHTSYLVVALAVACAPGGDSTGGLTARTFPGKCLILRFGIHLNRIIKSIIPAGSGRFSRRATTLVFAGEDSNAFPPHENRSKGLPWEVKILLKAPLRGAGGANHQRAVRGEWWGSRGASVGGHCLGDLCVSACEENGE